MGVVFQPARHTQQLVGICSRRRRESPCVRHAARGRGSAEIEEGRRVIDGPTIAEAPLFEFGPCRSEPEPNPPGPTEQIETTLAAKRTGERLGAVAHVGGLLVPFIGSEHSDAGPKRAQQTLRVNGQPLDEFVHDLLVTLWRGVPRAWTGGNINLCGSADRSGKTCRGSRRAPADW